MDRELPRAPQRDDKFIVTATKGFGKTLLLKAKRVGLQASGAGVCLPENSLLDKPIGDKIFSTDDDRALRQVAPTTGARSG